MAIRVQSHANISKQAKLLDGLDVSLLKWRVCGCGLNRFDHEGMNHSLNVKGSFKDSKWKCKYIDLYVRCVKIMKNINDKKNYVHDVWSTYLMLFLL